MVAIDNVVVKSLLVMRKSSGKPARHSNKKSLKLLKCCLQAFLVAYLLITVLSVSTLRNLYDDAERNIPYPSFKAAVNPRLESISSVDYYACCGIGHRLVRMSLANYVAKVKGFALRSFWGWCGEKAPIEVFSYLFSPQLEEELDQVQSSNIIIPFYNEVPGFVAVSRNPNQTNCPCHADKIQADLELYTSLRKRFRLKDQVDSYVEDNFKGNIIIGIHIRAGNGEGADFARKGRTISNPQIWVEQVSNLIRDLIEKERSSLPPAVYIATDTPSMVNAFRETFKRDSIPVLELPQQGRRREGHGVLFGVSDKVHNKDIDASDDYSSCLRGWTDTLTDMFLLSHADIVVAANPSSFSQTIPMSLAFGNPSRKVAKSYCEVIPRREDAKLMDQALTLQCYSSYLDWCCNFSTWIRFQHKGPRGHERVYSKEFVKFLASEALANFSHTEYRSLRHRGLNCPWPRRGRAGGGLKDKCIPHQWQ